MNLCFSYSLHQLIIEPTRTTEGTETRIDYILRNSPGKVIQSSVIEMGLSFDHQLIYCSRKMFWNFTKVNDEKLFRRNFCGTIKKIKIPWLLKLYLCERCLSVIDFVAPIKTLRVKFNTESRFDINLLNASQNRKNHYKPFKRPGKETDKRNFKYEKLSKVIEK